MNTIFTWSVNTLEVLPKLNDQVDVVVSAKYTVLGTEGSNTSSVSKKQIFEYQKGQSFVPFNLLTQAEMLTWIQNALGLSGIALIEKEIQQKIQNKVESVIAPYIAPPPWLN